MSGMREQFKKWIKAERERTGEYSYAVDVVVAWRAYRAGVEAQRERGSIRGAIMGILLQELSYFERDDRDDYVYLARRADLDRIVKLIDEVCSAPIEGERAVIKYDNYWGGEEAMTSPEKCPSCGLPEKHFPYGAQYCPDPWHAPATSPEPSPKFYDFIDALPDEPGILASSATLPKSANDDSLECQRTATSPGRRCSTESPHAAHTFGGRPMQYCEGVPEWRKCPQCGRENSPATWEKCGGKCPNCGDLHDKEAGPTSPGGEPDASEIRADAEINEIMGKYITDLEIAQQENADLRRQLEQRATGEFRWVCPFCPKAKKNENELKRHIRKHLYRRVFELEQRIEDLSKGCVAERTLLLERAETAERQLKEALKRIEELGSAQ